MGHASCSDCLPEMGEGGLSAKSVMPVWHRSSELIVQLKNGDSPVPKRETDFHEDYPDRSEMLGEGLMW